MGADLLIVPHAFFNLRRHRVLPFSTQLALGSGGALAALKAWAQHAGDQLLEGSFDVEAWLADGRATCSAALDDGIAELQAQLESAVVSSVDTAKKTLTRGVTGALQDAKLAAAKSSFEVERAIKEAITAVSDGEAAAMCCSETLRKMATLARTPAEPLEKAATVLAGIAGGDPLALALGAMQRAFERAFERLGVKLTSAVADAAEGAASAAAEKVEAAASETITSGFGAAEAKLSYLQKELVDELKRGVEALVGPDSALQTELKLVVGCKSDPVKRADAIEKAAFANTAAGVALDRLDAGLAAVESAVMRALAQLSQAMDLLAHVASSCPALRKLPLGGDVDAKAGLAKALDTLLNGLTNFVEQKKSELGLRSEDLMNEMTRLRWCFFSEMSAIRYACCDALAASETEKSTKDVTNKLETALQNFGKRFHAEAEATSTKGIEQLRSLKQKIVEDVAVAADGAGAAGEAAVNQATTYSLSRISDALADAADAARAAGGGDLWRAALEACGDVPKIMLLTAERFEDGRALTTSLADDLERAADTVRDGAASASKELNIILSKLNADIRALTTVDESTVSALVKPFINGFDSKAIDSLVSDLARTVAGLSDRTDELSHLSFEPPTGSGKLLGAVTRDILGGGLSGISTAITDNLGPLRAAAEGELADLVDAGAEAADAAAGAVSDLADEMEELAGPFSAVFRPTADLATSMMADRRARQESWRARDAALLALCRVQAALRDDGLKGVVGKAVASRKALESVPAAKRVLAVPEVHTKHKPSSNLRITTS